MVQLDSTHGHGAMIVRHIGTDFTRQEGFTLLDKLEAEMAHYQELGFCLLETNRSPFNLIVNCEVRRPQLANFLAVLGNFDSRCSIHDAFAVLPNHEDDLTLEINPLYRDYFGEARQYMQDILKSK